jgi:hypothetical protein
MATVTEASSTIRPVKPQYRETPYESPAKIGTGVSAEKPAAPNGTISRFSMAIDDVARDPASSTMLVDASKKVYAAVTQRIATLERELRQLREVATMFASMSRQSDAPAQPSSAEDRIRELLDLADQLPGEQAP